MDLRLIFPSLLSWIFLRKFIHDASRFYLTVIFTQVVLDGDTQCWRFTYTIRQDLSTCRHIANL